MMGVCCALMMSLALHTTCLSLFTQPVSESLGFPRAAFTAYISVAGILTAVAMPVWGKLLPKVGMTVIVGAAGVCIGVCFILLGRANSLWQFYALGFAFGFFSPAVNVFPTAIAINNWFDDKRGLAMGIAMAFSGVGAAAFSPPLAAVIASFGWRSGYLAVALMSMALTVPAGVFLLKPDPVKLSLRPYGALQGAAAEAERAIEGRAGVPFRTAVRSFPFYGVLTALLIGAIAIVGISQHIPALLTGNGLPLSLTGAALSLFSVAMIVAKIGLGTLNDRIGTPGAVAVCYALGFAGILMLMVIKSETIPIIPLMICACGIPITTIWPPILTARIFGQRDYTMIVTFVHGTSVLGYAFGTFLYGLSYDMTGSYDPIMIIALIMLPVAVVLLTLSFRSSDRLARQAKAR
jgi:MFS family permease